MCSSDLANAVAIDTEFVWDRTYYPRLGLVQIGLGRGDTHLLDAPALDLTPLGTALADPNVTVVLHDAVQDLTILHRATGGLPVNVFDTQRIAGLVGLTATASLTGLVEDLVGVEMPATQARTDWLRRPLSQKQQTYALADVEYLLDVKDRLEELVVAKGRQAIADQVRDVKKQFGKDYEGGARRTAFAEAGEVEDVPLEAMIDREPITVVCSQMGWIRAMTGHIDLTRELKFKDGDGPRFIFHAETTDKLLVFGANGRFYTVSAANLPGGRGMGEPLRLMVDLPNEAEIITIFTHQPDRKLLVASSAGDGFGVPENDVVAQTRSGKQVLNVRGDTRAKICKPISGDSVATVGENRKVLVFALSELPEMARGKGVRLQKYKDGGLSDATTFSLAEGLSWLDPAGRTRTETDLAEWTAKRATAGRMAPRGFPRDNTF